MKKAMFDELMDSVKEMDQVVKGKKKPARSFEFPDPKVKAIRDTSRSEPNGT